jgi:hypothetical protein
MSRRYIYGTNRECTKYKYLIQSETETDYNVIDVDMLAYDATYKVDKKTLKFTAINTRWQFIVDEKDFVASLDENEINKQRDIYYLEYLEKLLPQHIEIVDNIQSKLDNFNHLEKVEISLDDFNNLNIGDNILVYYRNKVHKAVVTSFMTTNKIDFTACFECEILDIYNKFVQQIYANEFNIDTDEHTYVVYLNQNHLDYVLNQQDHKSTILRLNSAKADLKKTEKRLAEYREKVKNY